MSLFFNFGENVEGYDYKVINERDARASAGIMLLLGMISLFSVFTLRTLLWAELFTITFIFEFFMRTFINPKYAPYMLLGGLIVSNQKPDWVEAKPKKFAWSLGMILGAIMTYYILFDVISLWRLSICLICLILLFLESAFGICLGCTLYHMLNIKLKNCAGNLCDIEKTLHYSKLKAFLLFIFIALFMLTFFFLKTYKYPDETNIVIIDDTAKNVYKSSILK